MYNNNVCNEDTGHNNVYDIYNINNRNTGYITIVMFLIILIITIIITIIIKTIIMLIIIIMIIMEQH